MPFLIIAAVLGALYFLTKPAAASNQTSETAAGSQGSDIAKLLGLASMAKKVLPIIGIGGAASAGGAAVAGGSAIVGTALPAAGAVFPTAAAAAPGIAGVGAVEGSAIGAIPAPGAAAGGLGAAAATVGLLAAPFVLGPALANLLGGKSMEEWEAQMKAAAARDLEATRRGYEGMVAFAEWEKQQAELAAKTSMLRPTGPMPVAPKPIAGE